MTDELTLHNTDRNQWLDYVAPNMARRIATNTDAEIQRTWPGIPNDYKGAVWKLLPDAQKDRIRRIRIGRA